ncbi:hypothetical protein Acr_21g0004730 [Actinidia rufa]|uniref:Uncharacterized protein n=1 Tax=Actinidia rufa TaxID=165716 RepID=A0A7J0GGI9_9ERIC|nr:hypothetical protein Acr_21g0004730 [Actinidia rufa]
MSRRIKPDQTHEKVEEKKTASSSTKGVVIHEKHPRDEVPDSSPNKKGKTDESKGKETISPPEAKNSKPNRTVSRGTIRLVAHGESTAKPGNALGVRASVLVSASMAKKIQAGVILPVDGRRWINSPWIRWLPSSFTSSSRYLFTFILGFKFYFYWFKEFMETCL